MVYTGIHPLQVHPNVVKPLSLLLCHMGQSPLHQQGMQVYCHIIGLSCASMYIYICRPSLAAETLVENLHALSVEEFITLVSKVVTSKNDLGNASFLVCSYEEYCSLSSKKRSKLCTNCRYTNIHFHACRSTDVSK